MQTLLSMVEPTLQEKGCLRYQVFQGIEDENVFSMIQKEVIVFGNEIDLNDHNFK